jgi:hypothetical protein
MVDMAAYIFWRTAMQFELDRCNAIAWPTIWPGLRH